MSVTQSRETFLVENDHMLFVRMTKMLTLTRQRPLVAVQISLVLQKQRQQ